MLLPRMPGLQLGLLIMLRHTQSLLDQGCLMDVAAEAHLSPHFPDLNFLRTLRMGCWECVPTVRIGGTSPRYKLDSSVEL